MTFHSKKMVLITVMGVLLVVGCGRSDFTMPTVTRNTAPPVRLAEFNRLEMRPVQFDPAVLEQEGEELVRRVTAKISANIAGRLNPKLTEWYGNPQTPRTRGALVIQPTITQLKFVTQAQRVWAGAMYGNSGIVVELKMTENGQLFHESLFFSKASGLDGAFSKSEDNMLNDISQTVVQHIINNYDEPFASITGVMPR